jgi:hypothetical protein
VEPVVQRPADAVKRPVDAHEACSTPPSLRPIFG